MKFKQYTVTIVIAFLFASTIAGSMHFTSAQTGTQVGGLISHDTVWTQANSPYQLTSNIVVEKGVTLTIEPGVTISCTQMNTTWVPSYSRAVDYYYTYGFEIDGTLKAVGTQDSRIGFTDQVVNVAVGSGSSEDIVFSESSSNCDVEYATFNVFNLVINGSSPIFYSDYLPSILTNNASPTIRNCDSQSSFILNGGSAVLQGNTFTNAIYVNEGSPVISNNTFSGNNGERDCAINIGNNVNHSITAIVNDNRINGAYNYAGIIVDSGTSIVQRNFITGAPVGIIVYGNAKASVENNTFAGDTIGLNVYSDSNGTPSVTAVYNNFEQNYQYNIRLGQQGVLGTTAPNLIALNNWWGTTDTNIIGQTIFDHKNDNNLGTVTFNPILTIENKNAFPNADYQTSPPTTPISTPNSQSGNPTLNPTPITTSPYMSTAPAGSEPTIPQALLYGIIVVLIVIIAALSIAPTAYRRKMTLQAQK